MATGTIMPTPYQVVLDANGATVPGAKITTSQAGTSTLAATYTDVTLATPNANPIIADASGRYVAYLSPGASYKFAITTSADVAIRTQDNIGAVPSGNVDVDVSAVAGVAIAAGEAVYLSDGSGGLTAGRWYLADGDMTYASSLAQLVGFAPNAIASGATGTVRIDGRVTGLSGLTAGSIYYASGTAGALTATPPAYPRILGVADTTTSLVMSRTNATLANAAAWGVGASVASNILTLSLLSNSGGTPSGADPVDLWFRNVTAATGTVTNVKVTAALTLAVPDTALLGTTNSIPFRLWVVAFNDGGTVRLGVINCTTSSGIYPLGGWGLASSTAVSTGSDSAKVFYTGSAVTSKSYVVLGYVTYESGLATAGTWSAAPTRTQPLLPDTPRAGDIIQRVWTTYATETASSSSTYADTGITATITPTSAANAVRVQIAVAGVAKDSSDTGVGARLFRDAVQLAQVMTGSATVQGTLYVESGPQAVNWFDLPAVATAVVYKLTFNSTGNTGNVQVQKESAVSTELLEEVMT